MFYVIHRKINQYPEWNYNSRIQTILQRERKNVHKIRERVNDEFSRNFSNYLVTGNSNEETANDKFDQVEFSSLSWMRKGARKRHYSSSSSCRVSSSSFNDNEYDGDDGFRLHFGVKDAINSLTSLRCLSASRVLRVLPGEWQSLALTQFK